METRLPVTALAAATLLFVGCFGAEARRVRAMEIRDVGPGQLADGTYRGEFTYSRLRHAVEVDVRAGRITAVRVSDCPKNRYTKLAQRVVADVLERQTAAVDVVAGATTSSKALLKAVELALAPGP